MNSDSDSECSEMCGLCPSCTFISKTLDSNQRLWKISDHPVRKLLVALLLRCKSARVLESIQNLLKKASWLTYVRSRRAGSPQQHPSRCSEPTPNRLDINQIWRWFNCRSDWEQIKYLCCVFSTCDSELLRMLCNLTGVLLIRKKKGFLHLNVSNFTSDRSNEEPEDPALTVVPGASRSMSGVSQYRDFIKWLPVDLSKRILGLLEVQTLEHCRMVCHHWQQIVEETMEERTLKKVFQSQMKTIMEGCRSVSSASPTYAGVVEIKVPDGDNDEVEPKILWLEERNVYCGAYYAKTLLDNDDRHRVLDYRGGSLMAAGSKDCLVRLLHVGAEVKTKTAMRGHVGSIKAMVLCEDRDLLVTAGCDATVRCWSLKTHRCEAVLCGHTGTINCLDVHGDRLVSGAKDGLVKVWSLETQKHDLDFKHLSCVLCVKINEATVCSCCCRGLVKIWSMDDASLFRVIRSHQSSVKCLFLGERYLLSGDSGGTVMAWSARSCKKECLGTFKHPKAVKSVTLTFLRVVTGCANGNIRIFNFLTGDCLREIPVDLKSGHILSLHFHEHSILVNSTSGVQLYCFAKVFWDYMDSAKGDRRDAVARGDSVSGTPATLIKGFSYTRGGHVTSSGQKMDASGSTKTRVPSLKTPLQGDCGETVKQSVIQSEKAAADRMKRRGPHHPPKRDLLLLRVGSMRRALCPDEVSFNMEYNAMLRDSWGPPALLQHPLHSAKVLTPSTGDRRRPKTCVPILDKVKVNECPTKEGLFSV